MPHQTLGSRRICSQCNRVFKTVRGLKLHFQAKHTQSKAADPVFRQQHIATYKELHPILDGMLNTLSLTCLIPSSFYH